MKRLILLLLTAAAALACSVAAPEGHQQVFVPLHRGEQLYNAYCMSCHGGPAGGRMMDIPPPHNANGHTWHHPDCQLTDIILNGSGAMGEMMRRMMATSEDAPVMPAFRDTLAQEDAEAILIYIKTWWTPQQRAMQARVTQERC